MPAVSAGFTYELGRPYQTVDHQLIKTRVFLDLPRNGGKVEATYAYQRDVRTEFEADPSYNRNGNTDNTPDLDFQLNTSTVDLVWEHPVLKKKITGSLGVDFITHGNLEQGTTYIQLIPNFVDYGGGVFAIEKMQVKRLTLEAGIRYDYRWLQVYKVNPMTLEKNSPIQDWQAVTVNAGATYRFNDHFSGTFNFGSAWRPPAVIELWADGIHQSAASWQFGDSALKLERAYNTSAAVKYSSSRFEMELGIYANDFRNYIYARPDSSPVITPQGTFPAFTYTQIKQALFEGIDLNFTYHFCNHFSWISKTSIVRARDLDLHQWIINVPADRYDNSLRVQWNSIGKMKNFYVGVNNGVVSKQTRVLPLPGAPVTTDEKVYAKLINAPAGYMLWGAEAGCALPVAHQDVHISLSVTNLTNVAYRDYLNLFRYYVDDLGRNITLRLLVPFGSR